jgi:diaminopimelate epimerase
VNQPIPFTKMSGSGNDFVVIDHRQPLIAEADIAGFTRAVCRRRLGIGADGLILIEHTPRPDVDFRWRYFNADGSLGEMCGNGAMCGARFAVAHNIAPAECRFETPAGDIAARVPDAREATVSVSMVDASLPGKPLTIETTAGLLDVTTVMVGVPHVVVVFDDVDAAFDEAAFHQWGRELRYHPEFQTAGTNVNAIHVIDDHTVRMRTWERGVEAETLACGTGAIASAIVAVERSLVSRPVSVVVSSGRTLQVDFTPVPDRITDITLTGEARIVAHGELDPEGLG